MCRSALLKVAIAAVVMAASLAAANDDTVFVTDQNQNQLIISLLSYSSVAVACSDEENLGKLRSRMVRLLESAILFQVSNIEGFKMIVFDDSGPDTLTSLVIDFTIAYRCPKSDI